MRAQEPDVALLHRMSPPDAIYDRGTDTIWPLRLIGVAGIVEVHPFERCGKAVRVALPPHLAIGDDVDAGAFLFPDRQHRRIVLGLFEQPGGNAPERLEADTRRHAGGEEAAVDEPVGLRVGTDDGGGKHATGYDNRTTVRPVS